MNLSKTILYPFKALRSAFHRVNWNLYRFLASPDIGDSLYVNQAMQYNLPARPRFLPVAFVSGWRAPARDYSVNERIVEQAFVFQHLDLSPGSKLLDVGCSESLMSIQLASLGYQVTGVDLNDYGYTHPNFRFIKGDVRDAGLLPESFDGVVAISMLEHCGLAAYGQVAPAEGLDRTVALALLGLVKRNGLIILTVPFGQRGQTAWYKVYDEKSLGDLVRGLGTLRTLQFFSCERDKFWAPVSQAQAASVDSVSGDFVRAVACLVLCKSS